MHDIRPILPELFEEPGTMLYVGARPDACAWLTEFHEAGNEITLLEVWFPNWAAFRDDKRIAHRILGNVADTHLDSYDYICWWHGPEHINKDKFPAVACYHRNRARRLYAVAAPWGLYLQGSHLGNFHEIHRWPVYEEDLRDCLFEVATDGEKDKPGSQVLGWIRI